MIAFIWDIITNILNTLLKKYSKNKENPPKIIGVFFCVLFNATILFLILKEEKSHVSFLDKNKGIIYNKRYEKTYPTNFTFLECVLLTSST